MLFVVGACGGGTPTTAPATTAAGGQPTAAGGGPTTAPGGGTDSCSLLTLAEIKSATGLDFATAGAELDGTCSWELTTADSFNSVNVAVLANTSFPDTKAGFPGGVDTTVSGHNAYWGPKDNILQAIWVEVGSDLLMVSISPSPANAQDITKKLAELVVARM
jgi:hypothetical protein